MKPVFVLKIKYAKAIKYKFTINSQILLEHVGMRREGILRKYIYFKNDENGNPIRIDTCLYAMSAEEWNNI